MTLAEINPLGRLEDGSFVALDAHMDMENEARPRQKAILERSASARRRRARRARRRPSNRREQVDRQDHRGVPGTSRVRRQPGLVIGAGGGALTLFDGGPRPRRQAGELLAEIGGTHRVAKACGLAKLVLQKEGVDKIA